MQRATWIGKIIEVEQFPIYDRNIIPARYHKIPDMVVPML